MQFGLLSDLGCNNGQQSDKLLAASYGSVHGRSRATCRAMTGESRVDNKEALFELLDLGCSISNERRFFMM